MVSLLLYGAFVFVQAVRHRDYFTTGEANDTDNSSGESHAPVPTNQVTAISALLLLACLGAVVLLAKATSPSVEAAVASMGAPKALVGVIIATMVLLPEALASLRALDPTQLLVLILHQQ